MLRARSLFAGALVVGCAALFVACETIDFRRGSVGETCSRTDDCESPLVCVADACADPGATTTTTGAGGTTSMGGTTSSGGTTSMGGAGGATSSGGTTSMGGTTTSGGTGGGGGDVPLDTEACNQCLHEVCGTPLAACDTDCLELEACIEGLCSHLSEIVSPQEGQCQVYCQQLHLASKQKHLNVVNCTLGTQCAPCSSYPWDYEKCRESNSGAGGMCQTHYEACNASPECVATRACLSTCGTLNDCLACQTSAEGVIGAPILDEYHLCISTQCIALSWIL